MDHTEAAVVAMIRLDAAVVGVNGGVRDAPTRAHAHSRKAKEDLARAILWRIAKVTRSQARGGEVGVDFDGLGNDAASQGGDKDAKGQDEVGDEHRVGAGLLGVVGRYDERAALELAQRGVGASPPTARNTTCFGAEMGCPRAQMS